ncbi:hypothetical protein E2C01_072284 [Portunus trituberculatus]|uniref:Endonuclease/exonuclease/phosphatase domain-containing protein n=1 Tax=Portunus trituberculatus TaxID=210409 RepID=A0A5B7I7B2_PORTR|nr:hypothetical protein [Portunus trituberculatus]
MQDFQLFHHLRPERRGGAVAAYCRSTLSPSHLPVDVPPGVEALWVRVNPSSHPRDAAFIIFCVAYHPLRAPTAHLLAEQIINTADTLRMKYPAAKLVICGDFNGLDVSEILHQLHLTQVVDFPTVQQAKLDLIMTLTYIITTPTPTLTPSGTKHPPLHPVVTRTHYLAPALQGHQDLPTYA